MLLYVTTYDEQVPFGAPNKESDDGRRQEQEQGGRAQKGILSHQVPHRDLEDARAGWCVQPGAEAGRDDRGAQQEEKELAPSSHLRGALAPHSN